MARRVAGVFFLILALCGILLIPAFVSAGEIAIVDDAGRTVVIPAPAERIVSFYAGHSENILALGGGGPFQFGVRRRRRTEREHAEDGHHQRQQKPSGRGASAPHRWDAIDVGAGPPRVTG